MPKCLHPALVAVAKHTLVSRTRGVHASPDEVVCQRHSDLFKCLARSATMPDALLR